MEISNDFKWYINTDTTSDYPCSTNYCGNFGICNCLVITKTEINHIDFHRIVGSIASQVLHPESIVYALDEKINKIVYGFDRDFDFYCIERILKSMKLYEKKMWNVNISDGYYGQVIESVSIKEPQFNILLQRLEDLFSQKSIRDRITFLLNEEYGFVPQDLTQKKWRISTIDTSKLRYPSLSYFNNLQVTFQDDISKRKSKIQGVCKRNGEFYEVIDGHHRLKMNKENPIKIIEIY